MAVFWGFPKFIHRERIHQADEGAVMFICNHWSNYDPVLLGLAVTNREIRFMAKKNLWNNKFLGWLITKLNAFPVDREGAGDIASVKKALKVLKDGEVLGIFPEGQRNKTDQLLLPFMEGASLIAHRTKPIVIPVGIKKRYGFLKRPIMEFGEAIDFSEEYAKKGDKQLHDEMTKKMEQAVLELMTK